MILFWPVGDAGPYKEKSNFLMRTTHLEPFFLCFARYFEHSARSARRFGLNHASACMEPRASMHGTTRQRVWNHASACMEPPSNVLPDAKGRAERLGDLAAPLLLLPCSDAVNDGHNDPRNEGDSVAGKA